MVDGLGRPFTSAGIMAAWSRDCTVVAVGWRQLPVQALPDAGSAGVESQTESAARFALGGSTI